MNIAVNTRLLLKGKLEGIGWFTAETLKRITAQHPEHHFDFFFDRPYDHSFIFSSNITPHILPPPARHPLLWYWWFEKSVPRKLKQTKADLFLSPDGYGSLSTEVKQVIVIHDVAFEHFETHNKKAVQLYYKKYTPLYAGKANRIATVSEYTKQNLIDFYKISADKIDVVYNGSHEYFHPLSEEEKKMIKARFAGGCDYFLYAGALQPRKNIVNLLRAFDFFKQHHSTTMKLILAGRNWNYEEAIQVHKKMKFHHDVIFTDHLSREDLSNVMAAAFALVYVSFFEGFGIPVLEAMYCDVPVITSNTSSMPEVAGDAALLVDPHSPNDIAEKMSMLFLKEELRQLLIEKGRHQRQKFSWQTSSERLWSCLMKATGRN